MYDSHVASRTLPVSELRSHLAAAIADVESGERILLTRHDRVVAALVPPTADPPSPVETHAAELLARLLAPAAEPLPPVIDAPEADTSAWVEEIRGARR